ncbi:helix-turn-helix transcriptional regulator [Marinobacter sp. ATCH36]|uniref:helix-turn-helix transcriptional regulator n=1 Tax=Marinobacter sp. ATCH36 TaxID=2945106 RepID=UPI0020210D73|nr:helix-turn-helix transcriptional regulator [Marinobacter sp. ATCH36]MCL7942374.1 helix-turn-helix transcriptional regulator [Marinobacter sp. ATCH36]
MTSLLDQIKQRRLDMGLKQHDMMMRVGMSRQQYQRLESKGNPRLDTLELIALGLKSELMLVPQEKLEAVMAVLEGTTTNHSTHDSSPSETEKPLSDDPWRDLLEDNE